MKLKNLRFQKRRANFNHLTQKHPWMKRIQICTTEGPRPFPRGDNNEIAKIYGRNLKIPFSKTSGPRQKASLSEGYSRFYKKGPFNFQKDENGIFHS